MDNAILVELDESLKDHGFSEEKVKDRLTIHFQKASNGGGDVEKVLYPLSSASLSKAIVVFSDKCDIGRLTACEHRVKFTDKEAIMIRVTVERLPQVFTNIEVEINPFYMNLLPRDLHVTEILQHRMSPQTKVTCPDNNDGVSLQVQKIDDLQQATNLLFNAIGLNRDQQAGESQEANDVNEDKQCKVNSHLSPQRGQSKPQQKKLAAVFSGDDGPNESSFSKATKKDTQTDKGLMSGDRYAQSTSRTARDSTQKDGAKSEELTNARPDRNCYQKGGAKSEEFTYAQPDRNSYQKDEAKSEELTYARSDRNSYQKDGAKSEELTNARPDRSSYQKDGAKSEEFTYAQPDRNSYQKDLAKSEELTYARSDRNSYQKDGAKSEEFTYARPDRSSYQKDGAKSEEFTNDQSDRNSYQKDGAEFSTIANSAQKQSGPFSVIPLLYLYLVEKHGDEIRRIEKQHEVIIDKVDQDDSNNNLIGIAGVNKKVSMEHLIQAEDEFADLYQRYFRMCSVRKLVLHEEVPAERLRKASDRISYDFPGILINTVIEDEVAFVGKTDEIPQALGAFRKEAGLNDGRSRRLKAKDVNEFSETVNDAEYVPQENSYNGGNKRYPQSQSGARPRTNHQHHNRRPNTSTSDGTDNAFWTDGGVEILVEQMDITRQTADIIVNASNRSLQNSGGVGVARAISDAAGPQLQEECDNIRRKDYNYTPIAVGECVVTKGYRLPCTYVIHVVGPEFNNKQSVETFHLELQTTFVNCLAEANRQSNVCSIAIPLVSSGNIGGPKDICASALVDALLQCFYRSGGNIQKVFLVNKDIDATKALKEALKEALKRKRDTNYTQPMEVDSDEEGNSHVQTDPYRAEKVTLLKKDGAGSKRSNNQFKLSDDDWGSTTDKKEDISDDEDEEEKRCPICFDDFKGRTDLKVLDACKHKFCKECIDKALAVKPVCPMCGKVYGVMKGNQPDGTMRDNTSRYPDLPGYQGYGCITIHYTFYGGTQEKNHPNPGKYYTGASRTAYLPNNTEGRKVLALLKKAFDARLTFTIGTSVTTGATDVVTWNDIHHKTSTSGGTHSFGYPDETYLKRVTDELAAKGIK